MSAIPPLKELPKCTRTTVIDHIFRRKYGLTLTQTIVLSYLLMLKNWSIFMDGYYILTTNKIADDLILGTKTVEASFTQLKKLGLIETKLLKVDEWYSNANFRAVRITKLGKEYNLSHYKPKEYQIISELQKEIADFRVKNAQLEFKNRTLIMEMEAIEKKPTTPKKLEAEKSLENRGDTDITHKGNKINNLEAFKKKTVYDFSKSGEPICNGVSNGDGWLKDTTFYINSYSRLSIQVPNEGFKQLVDPQQINLFWAWLFNNQHRVGEVKDYLAVPDISFLLLFLGETLINQKEKFIIESIIAVEGGVRVKVKDKNGAVIEVMNKKKSKILDAEDCTRWFKNGASTPMK